MNFGWGRRLSRDDIAHYQKIVIALAETIRLMSEIDKVIDAHGGWPAAFASKEQGIGGIETLFPKARARILGETPGKN